MHRDDNETGFTFVNEDTVAAFLTMKMPTVSLETPDNFTSGHFAPRDNLAAFRSD